MIGMRSAVVGRERVLAELGELLDAARAGSGAVVLLTGEAGIGKSTVADALVERARAEGVPVLVGRAVADEGAPAYWPWRRALAAPGVGLSGALLDVDEAAGERATEAAAAARFRLGDRVCRALAARGRAGRAGAADRGRPVGGRGVRGAAAARVPGGRRRADPAPGHRARPHRARRAGVDLGDLAGAHVIRARAVHASTTSRPAWPRSPAGRWTRRGRRTCTGSAAAIRCSSGSWPGCSPRRDGWPRRRSTCRCRPSCAGWRCGGWPGSDRPARSCSAVASAIGRRVRRRPAGVHSGWRSAGRGGRTAGRGGRGRGAGRGPRGRPGGCGSRTSWSAAHDTTSCPAPSGSAGTGASRTPSRPTGYAAGGRRRAGLASGTRRGGRGRPAYRRTGVPGRGGRGGRPARVRRRHPLVRPGGRAARRGARRRRGAGRAAARGGRLRLPGRPVRAGAPALRPGHRRRRAARAARSGGRRRRRRARRGRRRQRADHARCARGPGRCSATRTAPGTRSSWRSTRTRWPRWTATPRRRS